MYFLKKICLLIYLVILPGLINLRAQPKPYRNLILEGGGIRGIAYGGALAELDQRGILQNIQRVGGTSAGAIQAALLAVGYTPEEITNITFKTPIQQFSDGRLFFIGGMARVSRQYGWYRGEKFRKWMAKLIGEKTGNPHLTLNQLHGLAGKNNIRDFYVLGTNLSTQKAVIISHETYPNMKVSDAVRISRSIPLFFRAVFIDQDGNVVNRPKNMAGIATMVDGGILANYPIDIFDAPRYIASADQAHHSGSLFNPETLGIRLDTDNQIAYDQKRAGLAPFQIEGLSDYMKAFYAIIIEQLNRQKLKPEDWNRTISVSTKGYGERIRQLSEKDKTILIESGRQGVQTFFQTK